MESGRRQQRSDRGVSMSVGQASIDALYPLSNNTSTVLAMQDRLPREQHGPVRSNCLVIRLRRTFAEDSAERNAIDSFRVLSCVDGALRSSTFWDDDDCGRVRSCVWPVGAAILTAAGLDVIREVGPDQGSGLDTRDRWKVLPPRRPTDRHHAISTSATRDALYGVFLLR
jgi:hypothetical protein